MRPPKGPTEVGWVSETGLTCRVQPSVGVAYS